MATILLTGATGYIGSHTWLALTAAGFGVVGVDNFSNSSPIVLERLQSLLGHAPVFEHADVCDASAMASLLARHRVDATLHFAASKSVGESTAKPLAYYANNLGGLVSLCEAMQQHGGASPSAAARRSTANPSGYQSAKARRWLPRNPMARPS